jgi:predicted ATPase/DNA-binding SARP family transcriptional activator
MSALELLPSPLTIRLFGPLSICLHGQPLSALRFRKSQWLLALLALRHGREVERDWLSGLLWPEGTDRQALRNTLANLRQALGPEAARLNAPSRHTLALELTGATVDLLAFDAAMARGDPAGLETAVTVYRGPLLEGCSEEWVFEEREARQQSYLAARDQLATLALAAGQVTEAEQHLRPAVAADPLRESAQRALMQVRAAGGNYAAALLGYRELRLRLHRELNAAADAETQAVFEQLRGEARRRSANRSRGESQSVITGSDTRYGGATRDLDRAAPHQPTPPRRPHVPVPRTPLIGREREITHALALLRREETGLLTLTGAGGSGKTRLGLQIAAELVAEFEDGAFFVELAPLADPELVASAIAQVLEVRETSGEPIRKRLKAFLREKELLLVLDNFEHLLEAAPLVSELLAGCPRLKVLATSRAALRLQGEQEFSVPPLALSDPRRPMAEEALAPSASVELFLQRAREVNAAFVLTEANAPAVAEICRRLDGLPLAIELAAARTRLLAPAQMLEMMARRFDLLVSRRRDVPDRHQTLRATIEWSYRLLSPALQRFFAQLSAFRGSWTVEAAAAVCEQPKALEFLEELHASSLVKVESGSAEIRCSLLETVREYAVERLDPAEREAVSRQHACYFLGLAEQAAAKSETPERGLWWERLEREHDNFRAALAWSVTREGNSEIGLNLAGSLGVFWLARGHWAEGSRWLEIALHQSESPEPTVARVRALHAAGEIVRGHVSWAAGRVLLEESMASARRLGEARLLARSLTSLARLLLYHHPSGPSTVAALARESEAICRELGDMPALVDVLLVMGSR